MSHEPENDPFLDDQPSPEELEAEYEVALAETQVELFLQEQAYQDGIDLAEAEGIRRCEKKLK